MTLLTGKRLEIGMRVLEFETEEFKPYHGEKKWRPDKDGSKTPLAERPFIAWDGEGSKPGWIVNSKGEITAQPQPYILLMAALPNGEEEYISGPKLDTTRILKFMISVEERYPDAYHVAFGFSYDVNQIISSLSRDQVKILHKTGFIYINFRMYRIQWRKGKSLTVTRYYRDGRKTSITIYDAFSFFHSSFVKACEKFLGKDHESLVEVRAGKARRQEFTFADLDEEIIPYCAKEVRLLVELMNKFRGLLYGAGFNIRHWHGPGAIASLLLRQKNVQQHMAESREEVREAAQYAYAAGRFESFYTGLQVGPVWGLDINSAYPEAIALLPSLANGEWRYVERPRTLANFGVYRITSVAPIKSLFSKPAGPLFHRDRRHRISFPWISNGWFWTPETAIVKNNPNYTIHEGWEFIPTTNDAPFAFVKEMFDQRRKWQHEGNEAQYALKLALNSLYGKMAQRVGWNVKTKQAPTWHQLEWAGWVTSYTRAKIYKMMLTLGLESIIAVETDGIYTTNDPSVFGIESDDALGRWKINKYDSIVYIQSGLAWTKESNSTEWQFKYRGLDPDSLDLKRVLLHLSHLGKDIEWHSAEAKLMATTSRFVGAGAALMSTDFDSKFRRWEKLPRSVKIGGDGKRIHIPDLCTKCKSGITADLEMHELVSTIPAGDMSAKHSLPWLGDKEAPWREQAEYLKELIDHV